MSSVKRYILFVTATIIQAMGISLVIRSLLGTSPISSFPYVLSLIFPYTLGEFTFTFNMLFVFAQYLLLRRDFGNTQWLQIPITLLFACSIDLSAELWNWITPTNYLLRLLPLLLGTTLISFGVAAQGIADVIMLPGEGLVYAISRHFKIEFGRVKTANDVILVAIAAITSWFYLGSIEGIREGTLISALITGTIARFFLHHLSTVNKNGQLIFHPHL